MKKLIKSLLLTLMLLFINNIYSSHMMGGDIAYECISPGKYKLVVKVYRDCRGISFNNPSIGVSCKDGSLPINVNYTRTAINDLTEVCLTGTPPCNPQNTPSNEGIEEHVFEATIDFNSNPYKALKDAGCCEIMIKVEQCCRNGAINNISPGNFYTDAMINICNIDKTKKKCNTSPQLSTPPVAYICCNMPFTYNNGVKEIIDGDSLSYELVNPLNANQSNETYTGNFNSQIPMTPYCPPNPGVVNCRALPNAKPPRGFYFDKETGDIVFTPTKCDEVGVIVIQISEWRKDSTNNWVKIGYTRRDMQLIVKQCPGNNPPYFSINNKYSVCEGDKICFTILAKDDKGPTQIIPDTVSLTWNYGIPDGTFRIIDPSSREKEAEFCWQTKIGDARPNVYSFTATAKDDNCELPQQANKGYNIKVNLRAQDSRKYELLNCGLLKFNATPFDSVNFNIKSYTYKYTIRDSTNSGIPYFISNNKKDSFKFKRGGKYIIEHEINNYPINCPTLYKDTIIIPPLLEVKLTFGKDTFLCEKDSIILSPKISNGIPQYQYKWDVSPSFPTPTFLSNNSIILKRNISTKVYIQLIDSNKCVDNDTINIKYIPIPIVNLGPNKRICTYNIAEFDAGHKDTMKYEWNNGDNNNIIQTNIQGKYWVKVSDSIYGCYNTDTVELFVNDTVKIIPNPNREICIFDTLKVKGMRKPVGYPKQVIWRNLTTGLLMSNDSNFNTKIISPLPQKYEMFLNINQGGVVCESRDTFDLLVNALPTFKFNNIPPRCYEDGPINLSLNRVSTAYSGDKTQSQTTIRYFQNKKPSWITGGPVGVNSYIYNYQLFISNSNVPKNGLVDTICYEYRDYKGCYNFECKPIKLNPNPPIELKGGKFCQRGGKIILDNLIVKPFIKTGGISSFRCLKTPPYSGVDSSTIISLNTNVFPNVWEMDPGQEGENEKTGDYLIEYSFRDLITGCTSYDTVIVKVIKLPIIKFNFISSQCINNPELILDSFAYDNNINERFLDGDWSTIEFRKSRDLTNPTIKNGIENSIKNNKFYPNTGVGVYMLKLTDNSSGCLVEDSIEIIVNGLPTLKINIPDTICYSNDPIQLINETPSGNVGNWSGFGVIGREFYSNISPQQKLYEGKYKVKYEYTNPTTGCSDSIVDYILIQSYPQIDILSPNPYIKCENEEFDILASKKWINNIEWKYDGDGILTNNNLLSTKYKHGIKDTTIGKVNIFIETKQEGVCPIVMDSIILIIEPYPQVILPKGFIECEPALIQFNSLVTKPTKNLLYSWDFGNGDSLIKSNNPSPSSQYDTANRNWYNLKLKVYNQWGNGNEYCLTEIDSLDYIKILPTPKSGFSSDPDFFTTVAFPKFKFKNETKVRWGNNNISYLWNFNTKDEEDTSSQINPIKIYPNDTNTYIVKLISTIKYGDKVCIDSSFKLIKIGPDVTVFVPNVFSPEGTGPIENNGFRAIVNGEKTFHIIIINRWGEKLFESQDKFERWDGKYKNELCQQDVYAWVIKVTSFDGKEYQYEGTITLLR